MALSAFSTRLEAVPPRERVPQLDALRGLSLLGILLVNMGLFSFPATAALTGATRGDSVWDHAADFVVAWLATLKFYPLFSFLFGVGISIQIDRIRERGRHAGGVLLRRMVVLMVFGLLHALLIWFCDILLIYGLMGLLLLLFHRAKPRTLLIAAGVFFAIPVGLGLLVAALSALVPSDSATATAAFAEFQRRAIETYSTGTWGQILVVRVEEWVFAFTVNLFSAGPQILAIFLLGLYAGRKNVFQNLSAHTARLRRAARVGLGVGLPANLATAWMLQQWSGDITSLSATLTPLLMLVFGPVLTMGYVAAFMLAAGTEPWKSRLAWLAPLGRMALTNYLLQSVVCTLIFNSYGLGLYGQVGAAMGFVLSIVIWLVQLLFSRFWLRRFQSGPMEWLWRCLTYGAASRVKNAFPESAAP